MCCTRLKRLDVSAADDPEAAQATVPQHQTVASVPASSSLTSPLHVLTSLVDLNLANNELGSQNGDGRDVLETFTKTGFPRLTSLDLRNNFPSEGELQDELLRITTGSSAHRRGEGKRAAAARKETHARWRTTAVTGLTDLRLLRLLLPLLEEGVAARRDRHNSVVQGDDRARPKFHKHDAIRTVER
ncbi:unnamed protein product, partial [Ectocarpus sp. 13 AM-2016]